MTLLPPAGDPRLRCAWCGRGLPVRAPGPGRPRRHCRRSCRQRAYEARRRAAELGLADSEVVLARDDLVAIQDRLYLLGATAADVAAELGGPRPPEPEREAALLQYLLAAVQEATDPP